MLIMYCRLSIKNTCENVLLQVTILILKTIMVAINKVRSGLSLEMQKYKHSGKFLTLVAFFAGMIFSHTISSTHHTIVNESSEVQSIPKLCVPSAPTYGFTPLKEIEAEMAKSKYIPKFECELCLSGGEFHSLLYTLGLHASGPVLEEGSFCGCSTAVLAIGMKDGAKAEHRTEHPLITSDAFPVSPKSTKTPNQYRDVGGSKYELYVWEKLVFEARDKTYEAMKRFMMPTIDKDGSVLPCLMRTLYNNDLQDFVTVVAGSSKTAPDINYRLIFTDAAHDMQETKANEPVWSRHLFKGYPVIIAFHDVPQLPDVMEYILSKYKPTYYVKTSQVFVMEMNGQPLTNT